MAEYNKGKFFWIKLTDAFLTSDKVDFLMSQEGGANYVVLYQRLCLKTVNNDGILGRKLGEIIVEYDAEKIQRDCKYFSIDTVRVALELYKALGLVYQFENGFLRITDFDNLIGSRSIGAEKKALQRGKKNTPELPENTEGGQKVDICPPEIDIEIEKEKEKEIYKELYIEPKKKQTKRFVPPTLEEVQAYCTERKNNVDAKKFFEYYDAADWYDSKGIKMKSWKQKVITWEGSRKDNQKTTDKGEVKNGLPETKYRGVVSL